MYDMNLYPPIFNQSYMPAFASNECRVYFDISELNSLSDLYHTTSGLNTYYDGIQVVVRQQKTNRNALSSSYVSGIMLTRLYIDNTRQGNDKYYILINNSDIQGGFILNQYYKVQLRFTGSQVISLGNATQNTFNTWLNNNLDYFSQWSSVVLIRQISTPTATIALNGSTQNTTIQGDFVEIVGNVVFSNNTDNQFLQSYRIELYDNENLKQSSGNIYSINNTITYTIKSNLKSQSYIIKIFFVTNNLYTWFITKTFSISSNVPSSNLLSLQQFADNITGRIELSLIRNEQYAETQTNIHKRYKFETVSGEENTLALIAYDEVAQLGRQKVQYDSIIFDGDTVEYKDYYQRFLYYDQYDNKIFNQGDRIVIRRASNKDNFNTWDMVSDFNLTKDNIINLYWYDYTAEPGIWYRYQIVKYDNNGNKVIELVTNENNPVMLDTQDIFLNAGGQELIIRFDPSITSISNKIAETVTETIGSKFPFIRRNGNVNYKTFTLSGTISCLADITRNVFHASRQEIYGEAAIFYEIYNKQNNIDLYHDIIYEKHFRDKVIQFLQKPDIKLFRSTTEGNILVKLSNITFTPNQILGRKIYGFSCTVYEIADYTAENCIKYNIIKNNVKEATKEELRGDNT